jgi:hypothetical protein
MRSLAVRRPVLFSVLAVVVPIAMIQLLDAALSAHGLSPLAIRLLSEAAFAGYVILVLSRLRWWREAGFARAPSGRRLAAGLPLLVLPLLVVAANGIKAADAGRVVGLTLFILMLGFAEEGLIRGIVLRGLLPLGVRQAVVLSSLLFGIAHLANLLQGAGLMATLIQAAYAVLLGLGFAGVRLYSGVIWPVIALHALVDLADVAGRGFSLPTPRPLTPRDAVGPIILTGLCAVYGWWLLAKHERRLRALPEPGTG